ncbi:flagellar assembly protein FliH [Undibacterium sp. Ren11W]|uniref:flagellar assembly protein FliH n=1 Tax=Undibacterium sp. Ren11W TaxID=3413045 RepID=UPI003BF29ED5
MTSFNDEKPAPLAEQITQAKIRQDDANAIKEQAQTEGYAQGYQEGYAAGLIEGKSDGFAESQLEMNDQIAKLHQLVMNMSEQIALANQDIGQDLLNLAIELAQAMTKNTLDVDPEAIILIVKDAIEHIPSIQQPAQLILNPDDAVIIKSHMGDDLDKAGWRIKSDILIERGGCKLETAHNLLDATVGTRWQRLTEAMKRIDVTAKQL